MTQPLDFTRFRESAKLYPDVEKLAKLFPPHVEKILATHTAALVKLAELNEESITILQGLFAHLAGPHGADAAATVYRALRPCGP
jgi:hypothetical protein